MVDAYNMKKRSDQIKSNPKKYDHSKPVKPHPRNLLRQFKDLIFRIYNDKDIPSNEIIKDVLEEWKLLEPDILKLYELLIKKKEQYQEQKIVDPEYLDFEIGKVNTLLNMMKTYTNHYKNLSTRK